MFAWGLLVLLRIDAYCGLPESHAGMNSPVEGGHRSEVKPPKGKRPGVLTPEPCWGTNEVVVVDSLLSMRLSYPILIP